nr:retrotransposon protein, putative, unclassified [Tanacetum cinerariifolium]
MKLFGRLVTILNTLDHLGKFEGKADEGFLVGYFVNSKAFRVFNSRTRKVKENLHITFLENKSNVAGRGIEINVNTRQAGQEKESDHEYILLPFMPSNSPLFLSTQSSDDKDVDEAPETSIFDDVYDDREVGAEADTNNLELSIVTLVDLLNGKRAIRTKWVFRNKKDDRGIVVRNKARLVAQGYTHEEGIDYDDVFAPVDRIESIRRGTIDKTLFIKKDRDDILLVHVYVDDIVFGSTKKSLCDEFEQMMYKRFQMSSMRELTFFLGLHVKQKDDGIFISQDKYVADILKKFDFTNVKTISTPMEPNKALIKDAEAEDVDVHLYRSMIGSSIYLTASRPDIMFAVCACARFQVTPKTTHLHAVKRIFRYLKGQPKLGL